MDKQKFLREDWKTYKPKFVLCCLDCVVDFPQKTIKQQENRPKTIIITENLAQ